MSTPFDRANASIPVTIVTGHTPLPPREPGGAVLRLDPSPHDHAPGGECIACATRGDVRALLFDLLQRSRQPGENPLRAVVVDATALDDAQPIIERLEPGKIPAFGMRDFTVLRSFHLERVI